MMHCTFTALHVLDHCIDIQLIDVTIIEYPIILLPLKDLHQSSDNHIFNFVFVSVYNLIKIRSDAYH